MAGNPLITHFTYIFSDKDEKFYFFFLFVNTLQVQTFIGKNQKCK